MKALERRQAILEVLCERRYEKVDNLAFEFGVHRNTILNDIIELSLNYPIYTKGGRYDGGVYVDEDFHLATRRYLSKPQRLLLEKLMVEVDEKEKRVLQSIVNEFANPNKR